MTVPHPDGAEALRSPDDPVAAPPRPVPWHDQAPVVAVVALGGGIGAAARYGASLLWPTEAVGFPWTTFWVNVIGCFVIGLFMVVITDGRAAHRLVRPFFGTGVLGGFTTFSTYVLDIRRLMEEGQPRTALAYLAATLLAALAAVWLATTTAHLALHLALRTGPSEAHEKGKRSS